MKLKTLVLAMVTVASPFASFANDAVAGKAKSAVCVACHGAEGKASIPTYPNLAGQNAEYLKLTLKAYRSGDRKAGQAAIMSGMAAGLTDMDIDNLAAYYSSLK